MRRLVQRSAGSCYVAAVHQHRRIVKNKPLDDDDLFGPPTPAAIPIDDVKPFPKGIPPSTAPLGSIVDEFFDDTDVIDFPQASPSELSEPLDVQRHEPTALAQALGLAPKLVVQRANSQILARGDPSPSSDELLSSENPPLPAGDEGDEGAPNDATGSQAGDEGLDKLNGEEEEEEVSVEPTVSAASTSVSMDDDDEAESDVMSAAVEGKSVTSFFHAKLTSINAQISKTSGHDEVNAIALTEAEEELVGRQMSPKKASRSPSE